MTRLLWCLGAGWAAVALLRYAITPRTPAKPAPRPRVVMPTAAHADDEQD